MAWLTAYLFLSLNIIPLYPFTHWRSSFCLHSLVGTNKAIMDINVNSFQKVTRNLYHMLIILVLQETFKMSFKVTVLFCIFTSNEKVLLLAYVLNSTWSFQCFWVFNYPNSCIVSLTFAIIWLNQSSIFPYLICNLCIASYDYLFRSFTCCLIFLLKLVVRILSIICLSVSYFACVWHVFYLS